MPSSKSNLRFFHPTPAHCLVLLLVVEGILFLCDWFRWTPKGWSVLIAVVVIAVTVVLMLLWFAVAFVFHWRFQFTIRSLLILTVAVAIPFSWLAVEMKSARKQKETIAALDKYNGSVSYDHEYDSSGNAVPYTFDSSGKMILTKEMPLRTWLRKLLGDDFFGNVVIVFFSGANATDAGMAYLEKMKDVQEVQLIQTKITDAGLKHIKGLTQLKGLYFFQNSISDAGLANTEGLNQLQYLHFQGNHITDAGLVHLEKLKQLDLLLLNESEVTDAGLEHLKGLNSTYIDLRNTKATDAGVAELQKALPDCNIEH